MEESVWALAQVPSSYEQGKAHKVFLTQLTRSSRLIPHIYFLIFLELFVLFFMDFLKHDLMPLQKALLLYAPRVAVLQCIRLFDINNVYNFKELRN